MARLMLSVDFGPGRAIGHGKIRLLEAVRDYGSISAAGRSMGMSYRPNTQVQAAVAPSRRRLAIARCSANGWIEAKACAAAADLDALAAALKSPLDC